MQCLQYIMFIFEVIFILGFCYILRVMLSVSSTYNKEQKIYLTSIYSWKFQTANTQDYTLDSLCLVRDICVNNKSIGDWKHSYQYIHIKDWVLILTLCTEEHTFCLKEPQI